MSKVSSLQMRSDRDSIRIAVHSCKVHRRRHLASSLCIFDRIRLVRLRDNPTPRTLAIFEYLYVVAYVSRSSLSVSSMYCSIDPEM